MSFQIILHTQRDTSIRGRHMLYRNGSPIHVKFGKSFMYTCICLENSNINNGHPIYKVDFSWIQKCTLNYIRLCPAMLYPCRQGFNTEHNLTWYDPWIVQSLLWTILRYLSAKCQDQKCSRNFILKSCVIFKYRLQCVI